MKQNKQQEVIINIPDAATKDSLLDQLDGTSCLSLNDEGMLISWDFEPIDKVQTQTSSPNIVQKLENTSLVDCKTSSTKSIETARINFTKLKLKNLIYDSMYGKIYLGEYDNILVSICNLLYTYQAADEIEMESVVKHRMEFTHPNIAKCFGMSVQQLGEIKIVLEYMPCGNLHTWIACHEPSMALLFKMLRELAFAMEYIHSIKNKTIFINSRMIDLDQNLNIKITYFGFQERLDCYHPKIWEKVPWMAPEYLNPKRIKERNAKGDVYSFGVIAWELLTRQIPWNSSEYFDTLEMVSKGHRLEIPNSCPEVLRNLMNKCWEHDPTNRPNFTEICLFLSNVKI